MVFGESDSLIEDSEDDEVSIAEEFDLHGIYAAKIIKKLEKMGEAKRQRLQMDAVYRMLKKQHHWNIFLLIYASIITLIIVAITLYGFMYGYIVIG